jgi:hypothetical protein
VIRYVLVFIDDGEVTVIVIAFNPVERAMDGDAAPLATVTPFTLIVAPAATAVGVRVKLEVGFVTLAVYVRFVDVKGGVNVPDEMTSALRSVVVSSGSTDAVSQLASGSAAIRYMESLRIPFFLALRSARRFKRTSVGLAAVLDNLCFRCPPRETRTGLTS